MTKRKLLFIAGIPGTGKTTIGDFLAEKYKYIHINMEKDHRASKIMENYDKFITDFFSGTSNIVITWGFSPDQETTDIINQLRKYGFGIFWFDGNHISARKATMNRIDFDEEVLSRQMHLLDVWDAPKEIMAKTINVFNKDGNFRNLKDIVREIEAI